MASLIFAHAKQIRRKVIKRLEEQDDIWGRDNYDRTAVANATIEASRNEFREILQIARLLHQDYQEISQSTAINWYFVTIRPKPGVCFTELYALTHKFVNRAFMKEYTLTFEQKDPEGSGKGFHCHIVCNTNHRSKGELLRDTKSTFNKICADNCIDIKTTKNPKDIVDNYMIAYKSEDDHKIKTKNGDAIWRTKMSLSDIYENEMPDWHRTNYPLEWLNCKFPESLSSSPETATNSTIVLQLD